MKSDPLNKGDAEREDEQEPQMDHDGQEDNDMFRDHRDAEKTQDARSKIISRARIGVRQYERCVSIDHVVNLIRMLIGI